MMATIKWSQSIDWRVVSIEDEDMPQQMPLLAGIMRTSTGGRRQFATLLRSYLMIGIQGGEIRR
jgi:hypothetical protein